MIYTAGHLAVDAEGRVVGGPDTAKQAEYIYALLEGICRWPAPRSTTW